MRVWHENFVCTQLLSWKTLISICGHNVNWLLNWLIVCFVCRVHLKPYVELKDSDGRPDEEVAHEVLFYQKATVCWVSFLTHCIPLFEGAGHSFIILLSGSSYIWQRTQIICRKLVSKAISTQELSHFLSPWQLFHGPSVFFKLCFILPVRYIMFIYDSCRHGITIWRGISQLLWTSFKARLVFQLPLHGFFPLHSLIFSQVPFYLLWLFVCLVCKNSVSF